jgi:hypothetical protein
MKKSSHSKTPKKKSVSSQEAIAPLEEDVTPDSPESEESLAADQFAVSSGGDEASSSGHRVEPIEPDEEGNAQKLIEEGLHGYLRANPKKSHR